MLSPAVSFGLKFLHTGLDLNDIGRMQSADTIKNVLRLKLRDLFYTNDAGLVKVGILPVQQRHIIRVVCTRSLRGDAEGKDIQRVIFCDNYRTTLGLRRIFLKRHFGPIHIPAIHRTSTG